MSNGPEKKISLEMRIKKFFSSKYDEYKYKLKEEEIKKQKSISNPRENHHIKSEENNSIEEPENHHIKSEENNSIEEPENPRIKDIEDELNKLIEMKEHYKLHSEYEDDKKRHEIKVAFLIVATNKYDRFVEPLIESIEKYVLPKNEKIYHIFSDKDLKIENAKFKVLQIEHKPFPYPTLYRFHFFRKYFNEIDGDQLIYIDADTLIKEKIGTEILNPVTLTQHCGFVNRRGTFETRLNSRCYVSRIEESNYYGGGFYSFSRSEFEKMMDYCIKIIDEDLSRGITPVWHDESAMNKYMTTVVPDMVLSPSYHYPENNETIYRMWGGKEKFPCKILLLDKNHKEIRE